MAQANSKTRRKTIVFSLIGLVLIALGLLAIFRKREAAITIQSERVARRNLTEQVVANGKIQPVLQVKISPEVSGEIIELPLREGQPVKKGDLVLRIKPDFYLANRRSAEASYKSALANKNLSEASLRKAETESKRNEQLLRSQLVSESAFLEFKTAFEVAKASHQSTEHQVDVANAALARAEEELAKTTIYSPITGTVSKLNSQVGERVVGTAMMTGTEVMIIAELNEMEARVDIGEIDVVLIEIGQKARLEVDAFRDRKFNGVVSEIANSSKTSPGGGGGGMQQQQEATRFEVKIRIKEKEIFRPGMSITAEIETRSRTNVLSVPIQSVTTRLPKEPAKKPDVKKDAAGSAEKSSHSSDSNGTEHEKSAETKKAGEPPKPVEVVFVLEGDRVRMTPVKRGISDDNYVEITEGLRENQEVVSGGYKAISRELEEGKRIKKGGPAGAPDKEKK